MEEQSTDHRWQLPPSWLTQAAYPAGEHPARPAPEPAQYGAETTGMPSQGAVAALSSRLYQSKSPKCRRGRSGAIATVTTVAVTAAVALGVGYLIGLAAYKSAAEDCRAAGGELW